MNGRRFIRFASSSSSSSSGSEGDLEQERARYAALEQQCADLQTAGDQQQQAHLREVAKLRDTIERLEREQVALGPFRAGQRTMGARTAQLVAA